MQPCTTVWSAAVGRVQTMACWICGAEGLEYEDGVDARDRPPTLGPMDYLLKYLQELVLPLPRLAASPEAPPAAFDAAPPLANIWPPPADEPVGAPPPRTEPKTPSAAVANKGATPRASVVSPDFSLAALEKPGRPKTTPSKITDAHLQRWGADSEDSELETPGPCSAVSRKPTTLAKILEDDDTPAPALGDAPRRPLRAHAITQKHLTSFVLHSHMDGPSCGRLHRPLLEDRRTRNLGL